MPGEKHVEAEPGQTLLEVVEHCGLSIESGCRMGICGADPVAILDGMENLSPICADESSTLARLGYAENTRMACRARIKGKVSVALTPEKRKSADAGAVAEDYDSSIARIVVIGNGIAGVTAADHVRRHHPKCEIHLIGKEKHALYNRMGIARLIYGRSAMQGLYLLPDAWYDEHDITCWLNTHADKIDPASQRVHLATGEQLDYDRLILATGSSSFVPPIEGFGAAGTFVLREADDAMHIRDFAQRHRARHAVVAGGGLLGLEAAYALHKLGLEVAVLERAQWPLQRQVDAKGGALLETYLNGLGMKIVVDAETVSIAAQDGRVSSVSLKDGRTLPCDVFLACAGISPNIDLAKAAGLQTQRGVVVDAAMRASAENVFAVGDVAEYAGQVYGLWPAAVEQAEIAALNAVGNERAYKGTVPTTLLKVVGAELMSIGRFEPASENDKVIALEDTDSHRYRKLVISGNKIVGAILIGYPLEAPIVARAIKEEQDVAACLDDLQAGNWAVLNRSIGA
ncbi:MAG: FAD-dependent oxidoreductase [Burkholderiales bacterium]